MRLQLGPAWAACLLIAGQAASGKKTATKAKNIAIIGAGAAGSSAAYHLRQFAEEEGVAVNVTIFEKTDHIGGRTITVNAFNDPLQAIELGASIFVKINHVLYNATQKFDLSLGGMSIKSKDDITAIWDGKNFVFQSTDATSWWWDVSKMWWRYGTSPYWANKLVNEVVGKFLKLYEAPYFPFRSLTARAYELDLVSVTALTGEQWLAQNKIDAKFSREIIQAATRVNYASNLAYIHGLETMVSFATDGAVAVEGGNWRIFKHMLDDSKAAVYRNTSVTSISFAKEEQPGSSPKYLLSTKESGVSTSSTEEYPAEFDDVIIASPWQFSNIDAADVIKFHIEEIPYTKLHVTLFASPFKLRAEFFKLAPGSQAPSNVYTTLAEDEQPMKGAEGVGQTGFYSISTLRTATNPKTQQSEFVYKIFSAEEVTVEFLSDMLGVDVPETFTTVKQEGDAPTNVEAISWYYPHWFYSYPMELPRVTFQDPIIGSGLYYTSGIESFISTMETSALMGMNVARLIVDDLAGIHREEVETPTKEGEMDRSLGGTTKEVGERKGGGEPGEL
ncbi:Farnesylcysteine lyase-like protein [Cladobotryum mycophilum]|uniref:Farnesylcysteine lyase-like protein n=1 Tax=Cladobotryum mycophilum TaxID=491253 RepID=A0ABR0STY4_9HYPO